MKPRRLLAAALAAAFLAAPMAALAGPSKGDTVTVTHLEAKVMAAPKLIGKAVASVQRNDRLKVVEAEKNGWLKVSLAGGKSGYIRTQFVQEGKLELAKVSGGEAAHVSADEVALAGRGFNENVEKSYREKNARLDFAHVDRIQALNVEPEAAAKFAEQGGLGGGK